MSNAIVFQKVRPNRIVQTDPTPIVSAGVRLRLDPDFGGFRTLEFSLREGVDQGFGFTDLFLVRFNDEVKLTLWQENNFGNDKKLGSVTVLSSSDLNANERTFAFTEEGANVVLTYFVRKWPCDLNP